MKEQDNELVENSIVIPDHIEAMDWNTIRTYAKDLQVNIVGKSFKEVREAVARQESINLKLLKNTILTEDPYANEDLDLLTTEEKMSRLIRVKITNLNPNQTQLSCMPLTIANGRVRPPTRLIKFNVITHVTAPMVEFLRNEKYAKSVPIRDAQTGVIKSTRTVQAEHYNVLVLPPLTVLELKELAKEQRATNRLNPLEEL